MFTVLGSLFICYFYYFGFLMFSLLHYYCFNKNSSQTKYCKYCNLKWSVTADTALFVIAVLSLVGSAYLKLVGNLQWVMYFSISFVLHLSLPNFIFKGKTL